MTRSNSLRALTLAAILALGAPLTAFAAPANTGGAAEASDFQAARSMPTTQGSVTVAEQKGGGVQATGNPLVAPQSVSQMASGMRGTRSGNGASAVGGFGTEMRG